MRGSAAAEQCTVAGDQREPSQKEAAVPLFDVAIIGAGPAGASAAAAAADMGCSVALIERGEFPRDKVCGEFISAEALPLLASVIPADLGLAIGISSAEFIGRRGARRSFDLPSPALGLSRWRLDAALCGAAVSKGATLFSHATVSGVNRNRQQRWSLRLTGAPDLVARALIVAAGRWWSIAGIAAAANGRPSPWLGVKAHFSGVPQRASARNRSSAVEIYHFSGGYCGLAPVENGWTNACCLIHRGIAGRLQEARDFRQWICNAARHAELRERLSAANQATDTVITAPVNPALRSRSEYPVWMAGDAAGFIDPFTGDGLAAAILGGDLAGRSAAATLASGVPLEIGVRQYQRKLLASIAPSHRFAGALRNLVGAADSLQSLASAALHFPPLARYLTSRTRWRSSA